MLETELRKIHRTVGIYLVAFLALQALSGLFIALGTLTGVPRETLWFAIVAGFHHDWNPVGSAYRILLGAMVVGQGLGGVLIYLMIRARAPKPASPPPKSE
jgi:hypothetical protein